MVSITAALIVVGVLGLWFSTTRWMAICALAVLCALYPGLSLLVVVGGMVALYVLKVRQR